MTRVSIQAADNIIVVDRQVQTVDCSFLRSKGISAVQWYGEHGEIEFAGHVKPNERFDDLAQFKQLVEGAKPLSSPTPPTPQQADETHNRFELEYPGWRKPWEQRDAERQRLLIEGLQTFVPGLPKPDAPSPATPKAKPKAKK